MADDQTNLHSAVFQNASALGENGNKPRGVNPSQRAESCNRLAGNHVGKMRARAPGLRLSWPTCLLCASLFLVAGAQRGPGGQAAVCVPDPALPSNISRGQPTDSVCKGILDATQPPYLAAGDGRTDDTEAIQACVDDAYRYRMVAYLPANRTYLVSGQIRCVQEGHPPVFRDYG